MDPESFTDALARGPLGMDSSALACGPGCGEPRWRSLGLTP